MNLVSLNQTFIWGTGFVDCVWFLIGSAYFLAGSYSERHDDDSRDILSSNSEKLKKRISILRSYGVPKMQTNSPENADHEVIDTGLSTTPQRRPFSNGDNNDIHSEDDSAAYATAAAAFEKRSSASPYATAQTSRAALRNYEEELEGYDDHAYDSDDDPSAVLSVRPQGPVGNTRFSAPRKVDLTKTTRR